MQGISWLAEKLLKSQEGLCSLEVVKLMACDFFAEICFTKNSPFMGRHANSYFLSYMCINTCLLPTYIPVNKDLQAK